MKISTLTNAQLLDLMMARLGSRQAPKLRANVLVELNHYLDDLELGPTLPWFLEDTYEFVLTIGQVAYALPDDFLREVEDGSLRISYQGQLIAQLSKSAKEDLVYEEADEIRYTLFGDELLIAPSPDVAYQCSLEYYASSEVVADNGAPVSNKWLLHAHNLVTFGALVKVARFHIQDPEMAASFSAEETAAANRLWRQHEARQHANRDYKIED